MLFPFLLASTIFGYQGFAHIPEPIGRGVYQSLYAFDPTLYGPSGELIEAGGLLYGAAQGGAHECGEDFPPAFGCGAIFSMTASGIPTVVYSFEGEPDGDLPTGGLTESHGRLYGTTSAGGVTSSGCGAGGCGTVFTIAANGREKVLYRFTNQSGDGSMPNGGLIRVGATFYGTTQSGGAYQRGTVFAVSPSGAEHVVYSFKGAPDGTQPMGGLVDIDGTLYGSTYIGGSVSGGCASYHGCGTVFAVTPSGTESVVYSMRGTPDAAFPLGTLIDAGGVLYGDAGGGSCCGTTFSVTTAGHERVLYRFKGGADGSAPQRDLTYASGMLYGTTQLGGDTCESTPYGCGTIFSLSLSGKHRVEYRFGPSSVGVVPNGGLLDVDGVLYGSASAGGKTCPPPPLGTCGTVFAFSP
jgi:uncharacterized repeat protein (TIGR03803 family)